MAQRNPGGRTLPHPNPLPRGEGTGRDALPAPVMTAASPGWISISHLPQAKRYSLSAPTIAVEGSQKFGRFLNTSRIAARSPA